MPTDCVFMLPLLGPLAFLRASLPLSVCFWVASFFVFSLGCKKVRGTPEMQHHLSPSSDHTSRSFSLPLENVHCCVQQMHGSRVHRERNAEKHTSFSFSLVLKTMCICFYFLYGLVVCLHTWLSSARPHLFLLNGSRSYLLIYWNYTEELSKLCWHVIWCFGNSS